MISADNQQERLRDQGTTNESYSAFRTLDREQQCSFLAGFVDGEGSFNVSFAKQAASKAGWAILTKFQIYQHEDHRELLRLLGEVLGAGRIDKKSGSDVMSLTVDNRHALQEIIIPFFKRHPLATKADAFEKFAIIIDMLLKKEHLARRGFETIVRLAHSMNARGRFRLYSIEYILETCRLHDLVESSETTRQTFDDIDHRGMI